MARTEQPDFLGSPAFWNFIAEQQADPVVRRLHEQVGSPARHGIAGRTERVHPSA
jgi:hypothetical protein